ncbi:UNVERIFIED_ORG: hypothetical protein E4P37_03845 [Bacillus sp. AZ43]
MSVGTASGVAPAGRVRTTDRRVTWLLCLAVVAVRLSYVPRPLRNDEGGYLLVARQWHTGGEFLYGDHFVDRPPLLMAIVKLAALSEWDQSLRVLAIPFALAFVLAGRRAGVLLGGRRGGRWAALVAAGLVCSPQLGADQAEGELFGAALVMVALALALEAWTTEDAGRRRGWAAAAGVLAASAPLVKQNLLEGLLLLAVLVLLGLRSADDGIRRRASAVAPAALAGALLPAAAFCLWLAVAGVEPAAAWRDLVGFRGEAFDAIWSGHTDATVARGALLLALGVLTGLLPLVVTWLAGGGHRTPEQRALTAVLVFGVVAIAAGGSFWPPYLLQLAPGAVLAAGALAGRTSACGRWARRAGGLVVATALLGSVSAVVVHAAVPSAWYSQRIGEWLAAAADEGDTAVVAYGLPSVLESADLPTPYPYLWSVPMRTLDPDQERLRATLAGPRAPTWFVAVTGLNAWGIDEDARLRDLLRERYRLVAEVCGRPVWLRQDASREIPSPPPC